MLLMVSNIMRKKLIFISNEELNNESLLYSNPKRYIDDLEYCAWQKNSLGILVDTNGQCYANFTLKYARQSKKANIELKEKIYAIMPILHALSSGEKISKDRQIQRARICSGCTHLALINDKPSCGICKCQLKVDDQSILNLISLEETEHYGCKFTGGSQWKKNNC